MALFDNIGKKIGDVAKTTAKKSGEMIEITKINMSISSEEEAIRKLYQEIGAYCYGLFCQGTFKDEKINDFCTQVKDRKDKIQELKNKIIQIKGIIICSSCGAELSRGTVFCSKCGTKVPAEETGAASDEEETGSADSAQKDSKAPSFCPSCGAEVVPGAAFCAGCGCKLT